jgi:hypothetical protein
MIDNLELCSTDELISELLKRNSFVGFVVRSDHSVKDYQHKNFRIQISPNLDVAKVAIIMQGALENLVQD